MSLRALISRAETLAPCGISERFILQDDEYEVRTHLRVDGTTRFDIFAIDGEDRDRLMYFDYPFFMYRLDLAVKLGRCLLVLCVVLRDTTSTNEDKKAAYAKVFKVQNEYFPYQQKELV